MQCFGAIKMRSAWGQCVPSVATDMVVVPLLPWSEREPRRTQRNNMKVSSDIVRLMREKGLCPQRRKMTCIH